jgi:HEAT repeat protein
MHNPVRTVAEGRTSARRRYAAAYALLLCAAVLVVGGVVFWRASPVAYWREESARQRAASVGQLAGAAGLSDGDVDCATRALRDRSPVVRRNAAYVLAVSGGDRPWTTQSGLVAALADPDAEVRRWAAIAAARGGRLEAMAPACALAGSSVGADRKAGVSALAYLGTAAASAASVLSACLDDSDTGVRAGAAYALATSGAADSGALAKLRSMLRDDDAQVRAYAAAALAASSDPSGLGELRSALQSPDSTVRRDAAAAALRLGERGAPLEDSLQRLLADRDDAVSHWAGGALAFVGAGQTDRADIRAAVDALALCTSPREHVWGRAAQCRLGEPGARERLEECTRSVDPRVRAEAAAALRVVGR